MSCFLAFSTATSYPKIETAPGAIARQLSTELKLIRSPLEFTMENVDSPCSPSFTQAATTSSQRRRLPSYSSFEQRSNAV